LFRRILIANRGEIALRLVRAARDLGVASVAVYAQDDAAAPHVKLADESVALGSAGPPAYLDIEGLVRSALEAGCDAIHPGYGFLSERADFAQACADAGLVFVGPTVAQLALFGDKAAARALAGRCGVPLLPGSSQAVSLHEAQTFFAQQRGTGIMIKAIGGGGGRGMRAVLDADALPEAYARCTSEARAAFGVDGVYVERMMTRARHVEVQVLGDGKRVVSLGERDCSLQRRFQKLVEIAPSPALPETLRREITQAALRMAHAVDYRSLGTFEFLLDQRSTELPWVFIETNPRLQVEHTITEEVTGLDLVQLQLDVAAGRDLASLGLDPDDPPRPRGFAVQWRINAETIDSEGRARPSSGTLARFDLPLGPGLRIDTHGYAGAKPSPHYDTLLAKVIVHSREPGFIDAARRARRALDECRIEGMATNLPLLRAIARRPEFDAQDVHTSFVEEHLAALLEAAAQPQTHRSHDAPQAAADPRPGSGEEMPADRIVVRAPMAARVVVLDIGVGDTVPAGAQIGVLEAMKMEHILSAGASGRVVDLRCAVGAMVGEGDVLAVLEPVEWDAGAGSGASTIDPDTIRSDLQRVIDRHASTLDTNRPAAVAARHAQGRLTARENLAALCDEGSFLEYGALAFAAQTQRRSVEDLIARTPGDGVLTGVGTVNAQSFGEQAARCAVIAYDYTVLAGTQGWRGHAKTDRLLELARALKLPLVLFAEGGGGRPGDTDAPGVAWLDVPTFATFAGLNGAVPLVGIVSGFCFAGNAALLGCCDAIIATHHSSIGMGGPAMVEGGGLGRFAPDEIGPSAVQHRNGVIDILVRDDLEAVRTARRYLAFFQGTLSDWQASDGRELRRAVSENRLRVYDTRTVMEGLADTGSLLALRTGFGTGIHTALGRIEGRPIGLMANNPLHLGGAIDADAADKAARFMQLCDAHRLPIVSLVDTPGFMVGPDIESRAQVRHVSRMFVAAAHLRVPYFSVVLRKGYGLGAMAMTAGGFHAPIFNVAWPSGEFGPMGLEGGVRLGFRKELEAAAPGPEREALFQRLVAREYERGGAINMAAGLEVDAVIDPATTRDWLTRGLARAPLPPSGSARPIDTW
jgi:acetyl/propionyl-CoA carboxylase alpha subunit